MTADMTPDMTDELYVEPPQGLRYRQVDVFAQRPLAGNGLSVFFDCWHLSAAQMQAVTREMRQFESIFLTPRNARDSFRARIFTMEEELDFAGHPILGAACALHNEHFSREMGQWVFELNNKTVTVISEREPGGYKAVMDQGRPEFGPPLTQEQTAHFLTAMSLGPGDQAPGLPLQVVSTGLPYLILPISSGLERAKIQARNFEAMLETVGAKFAYVLDISEREGRTWDNAGLVEDIATGSAAGPAGAYLIHHGLCAAQEEIVLKQGRFVHRPSLLHVRASMAGDDIESIHVAGSVRMVARGQFDEPAGDDD